MKLTTGILLIAMTTGVLWAQNPNLIQSTRDKLNSAEQKKVQQENAALGVSSSPSQTKAALASPPAAKATNPKAHAAVQAAGTKPAPTRISVAPVAPQPKQGAQKAAASRAKPATKGVAKETKAGKPAEAAKSEPAKEKEKKTITAEGRRDPFISPVVSRSNGPNCSVGKRCLAIDQIMVRGVVKSESGMIAVVVNALNKAYFLKENDPVYNGYVLRITGDSVIFKETVQDRLGKEFTREVVKKITTPAV